MPAVKHVRTYRLNDLHTASILSMCHSRFLNTKNLKIRLDPNIAKIKRLYLLQEIQFDAR